MQEEWTGYTEFLEQGCDAALFVGMHAKAGNELGNMNHHVLRAATTSGSGSNGTEVGETGINSGALQERGNARSCS